MTQHTKSIMNRLRYFVLPVAVLLAIALLAPQPVTVRGQDDTESDAPARLTNGWQDTDFSQNNIDDWDSIISGGVRKDQIPSIDNPQFESIEAAAEWLNPESPVISVEIDGTARAYPLAILIWHEIANDELAGMPIAVTYCPLCNSTLVFDRTVDGQVLDFGVSGNLRNSDLIMYDRQTESWWQQFTGEAIVGDFTGTQLDIIPAQVIGFEQFRNQYPDADVLSRDTGTSRDYGVNPYRGYDTGRPFLYRGEIDERLDTMTRVLAGIVAGEPIAYPFDVLTEQVVINDTLGTGDDNVPVVAFWQPGARSALDASRIDESRDVGSAALFRRTVADQTLTFSWDEDTNTLTDDQTGSEWNLFGEAIAGELQGTTLEQFAAAPHFWFAWQAFYPDTTIYNADSEGESS